MRVVLLRVLDTLLVWRLVVNMWHLSTAIAFSGLHTCRVICLGSSPRRGTLGLRSLVLLQPEGGRRDGNGYEKGKYSIIVL